MLPILAGVRTANRLQTKDFIKFLSLVVILYLGMQHSLTGSV